MERLTDEERKLRRLESSRKYKQTHFIDRKASDLRQRQSSSLVGACVTHLNLMDLIHYLNR